MKNFAQIKQPRDTTWWHILEIVEGSHMFEELRQPYFQKQQNFEFDRVSLRSCAYPWKPNTKTFLLEAHSISR